MFKQRIIVVVCLVAVAWLLFWFNKSEKRDPKPAAQQTTINALRVEIELRPEHTGEKTRIHKFNADSAEVETETAYHSGVKRTRYWNELGKLKEEKLTYPNSDQVSEHVKLQTGGKIIDWKETYSKNGSRISSNKRQADGTYKFEYFQMNGRLGFVRQSKLVLHKDGRGTLEVRTDFLTTDISYPLTQYAWDSKGAFSESVFFASGKLKQQNVHDAKNNTAVCTAYREDGTISCRQYFKETHYYNAYNQYASVPLEQALVKSEIFSTDGKQIVRIDTFRWPKEIRLFETDGTTRVLSFKNGFELGGEKVYDKDGKLVCEKKNTDFDLIKLQRMSPGMLSMQRTADTFDQLLSEYIYKEKP